MSAVPRRPRRSCLAVPASSPRKIAKAAGLACDHVFLDLEDATAPAEKAGARATVVEALTTLDFGAKTVVVRINGVRTPWAYGDLLEIVGGAGARLDCVLVPKVEDASDLHFVDHLLSGLEADFGLGRRIGVEILVETVRATVNLREIALATPRLEAIVFGPGDYSADLGVPRFEIGTRDPRYPAHQWHWVMSEIANHARAVGAQAIDGPNVDFVDEEGYTATATTAKLLGFEGKWCIHPNQVPWANAAFSVAPAEVDRARAMLATYAESLAAGNGAAVFEGVMVDEATRKLAELVLERAGESGA